jgi:hypothetical protein
MTNADAPLLALDGITENPRNPWTGRLLVPDKTHGANIATIGVKSSTAHGEWTYSIGNDQWINVHDNIFKPENWSRGIKDK